MKAHWALLGWKGWVKYPDGSHDHSPGGGRGADVERKKGEMWADYVHRSVHFCHASMNKEQQA